MAQDGSRDRAATSATSTHARRPALTGKERLGPKWTDEQRIDNCNVPVDKRGTRTRPSACSNSPSS
jgi:ribosomal protein L27